MTYTVNGIDKNFGEYGKSTQREFDEAISALPGLIALSRQGDVEAGNDAKALLWALANEATTGSFFDHETYKTMLMFGEKERGR